MSHELILHDFFIFQYFVLYFKLVYRYLGYILFLYSISIFAFLVMLLVHEDKHINMLMTLSRPVMHNVRPMSARTVAVLVIHVFLSSGSCRNRNHVIKTYRLHKVEVTTAYQTAETVLCLRVLPNILVFGALFLQQAYKCSASGLRQELRFPDCLTLSIH